MRIPAPRSDDGDHHEHQEVEADPFADAHGADGVATASSSSANGVRALAASFEGLQTATTTQSSNATTTTPSLIAANTSSDPAAPPPPMRARLAPPGDPPANNPIVVPDFDQNPLAPTPPPKILSTHAQAAPISPAGIPSSSSSSFLRQHKLSPSDASSTAAHRHDSSFSHGYNNNNNNIDDNDIHEVQSQASSDSSCSSDSLHEPSHTLSTSTAIPNAGIFADPEPVSDPYTSQYHATSVQRPHQPPIPVPKPQKSPLPQKGLLHTVHHSTPNLFDHSTASTSASTVRDHLQKRPVGSPERPAPPVRSSKNVVRVPSGPQSSSIPFHPKQTLISGTSPEPSTPAFMNSQSAIFPATSAPDPALDKPKPPLPPRPTVSRTTSPEKPPLNLNGNPSSAAHDSLLLRDASTISTGPSQQQHPPPPPLPSRPGQRRATSFETSAAITAIRDLANIDVATGSTLASAASNSAFTTSLMSMNTSSSGVPATAASGTSATTGPASRYAHMVAKEPIFVPITRFSDRSLPIPDSLPTTEILHKGPVRSFDFSGFNAMTGQNTARIWYIPNGENTHTYTPPSNDFKIYAVAFVPGRSVDTHGRVCWVATDRGELLEIEVDSGAVLDRRTAHTATVSHILRHHLEMYTLDENGGFKIWMPGEDGRIALSLRPRSLRVSSKLACVLVVDGNRLWAATGKHVEVYNLAENADALVERRIDMGIQVGPVSAIAALPKRGQVYTAHEDGKITVFDAATLERRRTFQVAFYRIGALLGVGDSHLWAGLGTGKIAVYDTAFNGTDAWAVINEFPAYHNASVAHMCADDTSLAFMGRQHIASVSDAGHVRFWDGLLSKYRLDRGMRLHSRDFCDFVPANILVLTWNIDSRKPTDMDAGDVVDRRFLNDVLSSDRSTQMYVFGLQELVDLESKSETAKQLFKNTSSNQTNIDQRQRLWQDRFARAIEEAQPEHPFTMVECRQLVGLFQCIFIRTSEMSNLTEVAVSMVKTGLGGYHGNKGGIATRFLWRDTSMCFINCHLAAHQSHTSARNNDIAHIMKEMQFPRVVGVDGIWARGGDGSAILDHDMVFWSGDLNYRIDLSRAVVMEKIDAGDWPGLWEHDQLIKQKRENPSFGLRDFDEGVLAFAPTFKYNRGSLQYDGSEKQRVPAYCDRVLWFDASSDSMCSTNLIDIGTTHTGHVGHGGGGNNNGVVKQTMLARGECKISDHRPIAARFTLHIKTIHASKRDATMRVIQSGLDNMTESAMRAAQIDWVSHARGIEVVHTKMLLEQCGWNLKLVR